MKSLSLRLSRITDTQLQKRPKTCQDVFWIIPRPVSIFVLCVVLIVRVCSVCICVAVPPSKLFVLQKLPDP